MPDFLSSNARDRAVGPKIDWSREELKARFPQTRLAELEANLALPKFSALFDLPEKLPGTEVYLTGGILRDTLLGHEPKDYDFIVRFPEGTDGARQKFEDFFGEKFYATAKDKKEDNWKIIGPGGTLVYKGKDFGVYKFTPAGEREALDLAFPRTDEASVDSTGGAHDFKIFSDPTLPVAKEIKRRDFTVNALVMKLERAPDGKINLSLFDHVGGLDDLAAGKLRAVGDAITRLNEDKRRVARALRFAAKNKLAIEDSLGAELRRQASARVFEQRRADGSYVVPRETLAPEVLKGFAADPVGYIDLVERYGFLDSLFPDLTAYRAPERLPTELAGKEGLLSDSRSDADLAIRQQIFGDAKAALAWHRENFGAKADANELSFLLLHETGKCAALKKPNGAGKAIYPGYLSLSQELMTRAVKELRLDGLEAGHSLRIRPELFGRWLNRYASALSLFSPTMSKDLTDENKAGPLVARAKAAFPELSHDPLWRIVRAKFATGTDVGRGRDELPAVAALLAQIEQREASAPAKFDALINGKTLLADFSLLPGRQIGELIQTSWKNYCGQLASGEYRSPQEMKRGLFTELLRGGKLTEIWNKKLVTADDCRVFLLDENAGQRDRRTVRCSLDRALERASAAAFLGESLNAAAEAEPALRTFLDARERQDTEPTPAFENIFAASLARDPERVLAWLENGFKKNYSLPSILFPELRRLPGTKQDTVYHSEGDAWVHTKLMFAKAKEQGIEITPALALTLLYHDVAKPDTAKTEGDRIHFLRHASIGADQLAEKIDRLDWADTAELNWAEIVNADRHHDLRFVAWRDKTPSPLELRPLMREGRDSLLYNLIRCDLAAGIPADSADREKDLIWLNQLDRQLELIEREIKSPDFFDRLAARADTVELIGKNSPADRLEILYQKFLEKLPTFTGNEAALSEQVKAEALLATPRWLKEFVTTKIAPARELMERFGLEGEALGAAHREIVAAVTAKLAQTKRLDSLNHEETISQTLTHD